jgi:sugar phosphate isomerase/epimerase
MINRRTFVKTLSAGVAASLVLPGKLLALPLDKLIGIQLYTLHNQMKEDVVGTMDQVAKIGFNAIETAGYAERKFYGYSPEEFKTIVEDMGMIPQSSHAGITVENIDEVIEDTVNAGMSYLVLPSLNKSKRNTLDDYRKVADEFNMMGEKCKEAGLIYAYHNHAFEFEKLEDSVPYDILLENTDPELVTMQLDLYWMVYGGCDPVEYFNRYPGRFELFHVKDMSSEPSMESTEIGEGSIDFKTIFAEKEKAGMKNFYLEQESFHMDPFASITISYNYLKTLID